MLGRNMKLILCCSVMVFLIGCKKNSSVKVDQQNMIISDFLMVSIKGKLKEDDIIEVYFEESVQDPYTIENKQSLEVKGSSEIQDMVFRLPNRVYPMKLRIDLGSKGYETPFEIMEITISTGGKSKTFSVEEIKRVFRMNQYVEMESGSNRFIRKEVNGTYDPFILSGDLTNTIVELFSK